MSQTTHPLEMKHLPSILVLFVALPVGAQNVAPMGSLGQVTEKKLQPGLVFLLPKAGGTPILQPTIQAAVDAASEGDTVLLSDGIFQGQGNRDVFLSGKNIEIRSQNGPANCLIDCENLGRGFLFEGPAVTDETLLLGVGIARGRPMAPAGGGILSISESRPTIDSCVVFDCAAQQGGGIDYEVDVGFPRGTIRNCWISRNQASPNMGAGIFVGNVVVDSCMITGNVGFDEAAGAYLGNSAVLRNSIIANNRLTSPFPTLGGGVVVDLSGFGVPVEITGCTIVGNSASQGGGVFILPFVSLTVRDCILWGNAATLGGSQLFHAGSPFGPIDTFISHCDIEGGVAGIGMGPGAIIQFVSLLNMDPKFLDARVGDYRLSAFSPCLERGDPLYVPLPNETDLERQPRVNGLVDIGADERWPGLALTLVTPGRAGGQNSIQASGADPGEVVAFFSGSIAGRFALPFGACPTLALGIADMQCLGCGQASSAGIATYAQHVPAAMSGVSILLQAVGFDPFDPAAGCAVSNLVQFTYP